MKLNDSYDETIVKYNSHPYKVTREMIDTQAKKVESLEKAANSGRISKKEQQMLDDERNKLGFLRRTSAAQQHESYVKEGRADPFYDKGMASGSNDPFGKYEYVIEGRPRRTNSAHLAASYNAQHRFFSMSEPKKALAKAAGQQRKLSKLFHSDAQLHSAQYEQEVKELNGMFRKK